MIDVAQLRAELRIDKCRYLYDHELTAILDALDTAEREATNHGKTAKQLFATLAKLREETEARDKAIRALDASNARLATAERIIVEAEALAVRMQRERDEARRFIGLLVQMHKNGGWKRAVIRDTAAAFLERNGGNPVPAKDTTPDFARRVEP